MVARCVSVLDHVGDLGRRDKHRHPVARVEGVEEGHVPDARSRRMWHHGWKQRVDAEHRSVEARRDGRVGVHHCTSLDGTVHGWRWKRRRARAHAVISVAGLALLTLIVWRRATTQAVASLEIPVLRVGGALLVASAVAAGPWVGRGWLRRPGALPPAVRAGWHRSERIVRRVTVCCSIDRPALRQRRLRRMVHEDPERRHPDAGPPCRNCARYVAVAPTHLDKLLAALQSMALAPASSSAE